MSLRLLLVDDESLARDRLRGMLTAEPDIEVTAECANGPSAVALIQTHDFDLVFLDIRMPGMDGFEVLGALRGTPLPAVVFLTGYEEHAVRAFEERALDYLLKPVARGRLRETLDRARERQQRGDSPADVRERLVQNSQHRRLAVPNGTSLVFVDIADIDWIESAGNYALLHAGEKTHILRETMAALEERLPAEEFFRVSRGAIVNVSRVQEMNASGGSHRVILRDGRKIAVTRAWREFAARLR